MKGYGVKEKERGFCCCHQFVNTTKNRAAYLMR